MVGPAKASLRRPLKTLRFKAEVLAGHKGEAVIVPFNPATTWGSPRAQVPRPWKLGHLVRGTLNGTPFEGWIGFRWGRFFMFVDPDLQRRARVGIGDEVDVALAPRTERPAPRGPARSAERISPRGPLPKASKGRQRAT